MVKEGVEMSRDKDTVKISFTFTDGCRFATEINAQMWLKKIGLSKVSTGEGDIYRMQLYPVEMLVPLHIAAEAIEDMLHMLPEEKLIEILRSAEERFKNW